MPLVYTRRLSAEELKGNYIMITMNKLNLFPKPEETFTLRVRGEEFDTRIDRVSCHCRGPDKPHYHWYLDTSSFSHLLGGSEIPQVTIYKLADGVYGMTIMHSMF